MSESIQTLSLHAGDDYIELYKVLKAQGMCSDGGLAKHVIAEGLVSVNGEVETRKRKKLLPGDVVSFQGQTVQIVAA
ncbi:MULTISPECIES: RNA-binding S4 domain-containing protein [Shewanella]|uniref:RNA-binding S4 domain-containing protein n=1 Tax=Shewanella TaxID=22 RepID=UPI001D18EA49|nr:MULTISPECIES: RNA-binding S4 domain-containing protein [Shewanella]